MTPRLTRTVSLAVACLSVGLLSACSSGGPQPGVAALVGDETIRVNEVNRLTDGFCEAARRDFQSRGDVYPMNVLSSVVAPGARDGQHHRPAGRGLRRRAQRGLPAAGGRPRAELRHPRPRPGGGGAPGAGQRALPLRHPDRDRPARSSRRRASPSRASTTPSPGAPTSCRCGSMSNPPGSTRSTTSRWTRPQAGSVDTTTSHAVTTAAVDAMLADQFAIRELEGEESERSAPTSAACPRRSAAADVVADGPEPTVRGPKGRWPSCSR